MSSSIALFLMKVFNAGLAFLTNLLVARLVGVQGFGIYSIVMAIISVMSVLSGLGLESLALKEVAVEAGRNDHAQVSKINNASLTAVVLTSILIALGIATLFPPMHIIGMFPHYSTWLVLVLAVALPLVTVNRHLSFLQLARMDVLSQSPLLVVAPVLMLASILLFKYTKNAVDVDDVLLAFALSNGVVLMIYLRRGSYHWVRLRISELVRWVAAAKYFFLLNVAQIINVNIAVVMLGMASTETEVGVFAAASKLSSVVLFLLYATNATLMPTIADGYHNNKRDALQKALFRANRLSFVVSVAMLAMVYAGGEWALGLFGHGFGRALHPLIILTVGMTLCAVANAAGPLLSMTGHVKKVALLAMSMVAVAIGANFMLVPVYGATGAALATSIVLVLQNVIAVLMIYKYVGVNPTLFGRIAT